VVAHPLALTTGLGRKTIARVVKRLRGFSAQTTGIGRGIRIVMVTRIGVVLTAAL
jgi:hypothetical protein